MKKQKSISGPIGENTVCMNKKLFHLKQELRKFLECPIVCEKGSRLESISCSLYSLWNQIKLKHYWKTAVDYASLDEKETFISQLICEDYALKVMCEGKAAIEKAFEKYSGILEEDDIEEVLSFLDPLSHELDLELIDNEEEAEKELRDVKIYIQEARKEFINYASIFECRVANRNDYPKHFPLKTESIPDIKIKTEGKNAPSLFYPGISEIELDWVLVSVMADAFWDLIKKDTHRIAVDCMCIVGASKGKDTDHIIFEFNKSSKIAHAYPVLKDEVPSNVLAANCDSLQGCIKSNIR